MFDSANKNTQQEMKRLVLARMSAVSDDFSILIGDHTYSKNEILENIQDESEIGKEIINLQLEYLRDMANGALYE